MSLHFYDLWTNFFLKQQLYRCWFAFGSTFDLRKAEWKKRNSFFNFKLCKWIGLTVYNKSRQMQLYVLQIVIYVKTFKNRTLQWLKILSRILPSLHFTWSVCSTLSEWKVFKFHSQNFQLTMENTELYTVYDTDSQIKSF